MEVITLNGKEFVRAVKAAREVGYTADYVGQLCRSGAISAERVGRSWYVARDELREHKVEKKRNSRSKAREHVRKVLEEKEQTEKPKTQKSIATQESGETSFEHHYLSRGVQPQYAQDEGPLMPKVEKTALNKDFRDYVVDDVPEFMVDDTVEESEEEVREDVISHTRIPITVREPVQRISHKKIPHQRTQRSKKTSVHTLSFTPEAIARREKHVHVDDDYEEAEEKKGAFLHGLVTVAIALVMGLSIIGTEVSLITEETHSGDRSFVQLTQEYNVNLSAAVANILLKI